MKMNARLLRTRQAVTAYVNAREAVIQNGFLSEILWQQSQDFLKITESEFMRQLAWVVLSSGMRESVISAKFPQIAEAFGGFYSARHIISNAKKYRSSALSVFGHSQKIEAIIESARIIEAKGFRRLKEDFLQGDVDALQVFPFIGPVTSFHLAKNLGMDVVKPDRHLIRIAGAAGYESPHAMCQDISTFVGERMAVVDLVLWRYATLFKNYLVTFAGRSTTQISCSAA